MQKRFEKRDYGLIILIIFAVFASFSSALDNEFLNWDDNQILLDNDHYKGFSPTHLKWMFTSFFAGHYHPFTWLSYAIDYQLWGMNPTGFHLSNIILHALNASLFYVFMVLLFSRLASLQTLIGSTGFRRLCAAGVLAYALHPLRVESVAWATERRDVLSGFFYLLTLIAYLRWHDPQNNKSRKWMALSIVFFASSLMSKAWGITLPVVLLILDAWPLGRIGSKEGWLSPVKNVLPEKIPFFLLALIFATTAFLAQKQTAMHMVPDHTLLDRVMQAFYGLCFYPVKTLFPINLSPLYLLKHDFNPLAPINLIAAVAVIAVTAGLFAMRHRWPWALTAWLIYGVIVSPVLGITQSGSQITADRYSYLSTLPFYILLAAGLIWVWSRSKDGKGASTIHYGVAGVSTFMLLAFAASTFLQANVWQNSFTLWDHAVRLDATNYFALYNRGRVLQRWGDEEGAMQDYDRAIELSPEHPRAYVNRGILRHHQGDQTGALEDYKRAIEINVNDAGAYLNRGNLYQSDGDFDRALEDFSKSIELNPENPVAYNNRGNIYQITDRPEKALADYDIAIRLDPDNANAHSNRGRLRERFGDRGGALEDYNEAIALDPENADAYFDRATLQRESGNYSKAIEDYTTTIQLDPEFIAAYSDRGALRGNMGDLKGALEDYNRVIALDPDRALAYLNRGAIREQLNNIPGAMDDYNRSIQLDPTNALAYNTRGMLRRAQDNIDGAIEDYNRAIELDATLLDAYVNRGGLRGNLGDIEGVIADYSKALELAPRNWPNRRQVEQLIEQARGLLER